MMFEKFCVVDGAFQEKFKTVPPYNSAYFLAYKLWIINKPLHFFIPSLAPGVTAMAFPPAHCLGNSLEWDYLESSAMYFGLIPKLAVT